MKKKQHGDRLLRRVALTSATEDAGASAAMLFNSSACAAVPHRHDGRKMPIVSRSAETSYKFRFPRPLTLVDAACAAVSVCREDVSKSELIVGEFSVSPSGPQGELSVRITGPNGFTAFEKRNANDGKFAFTSSEPGEHRICFTNAGMSTSFLSLSRNPCRLN